MNTKIRRSQDLMIKARQLLERGRVQDALGAAADAERNDPGNADIQFLLAAIHAQRQDFPRVAEHCRNVIKRQPGNAAAHFNLGLACQSMGKPDLAAEAYRNAIARQPGYPAALVNLAAVMLDTGNKDEALSCAEAALAAAPNLPAAHLIKGRAMLLGGQGQAALEYLHEARRRFGDTPEINVNIAQCRKALGHVDEAREMLTEVARTAPGYAPAWVELGHLERQAERYADAAQHYERAARLRPTPDVLFNLAHCLYAADWVEPARRLYHELLEKDPDNVLVHNNLGRLYERLGQLESAERHLRRAVELQPGRAVPHCNLGRVLYGQGDYAAARKEFELAVAAEPDYFEGHYGRGQALCELGEYELAVESFKAAQALKPDLTEAKYYIASLGHEGASDADRQEYIAGLFDQYAEKFDHELVGRLKYGIPEEMFDAMQALLPPADGQYDILDLGCGTGLCAPLFRPIARHMTGVDLSSRMIEKARARNLYDELEVDDVTKFMERATRRYGIIIAADVFVYLGDLSATFAAVHSALEPSGYFVFSTETSPGEGFLLHGTGRHTHSKKYIAELAHSTGFSTIKSIDCSVRLEYGKPAPGTVYVLQKR